MAFIDAIFNLGRAVLIEPIALVTPGQVADFTSEISCHIAMAKLVTSNEALCDLDIIGHHMQTKSKNNTEDLQKLENHKLKSITGRLEV